MGTYLIKDYDFKNFIETNSNKFALESALAVAKKPSEMNNPLYIYGNKGTGKTHLMNAIGTYIHTNTDKKVLRIITFIDDVIVNKDTKEVKEKYSDVDVFLFEDIETLEKSEVAQKKLFNLFNACIENNKQMVFTSNKAVDDLDIDDKLKNRLKTGLSVEIQTPDKELKAKLFDKFITESNITYNFTDEIKDYIINNCGSRNGIRSLESAINKVVDYAKSSNVIELTLELVEKAIEEFNKNKIWLINTDVLEQLLISDKYGEEVTNKMKIINDYCSDKFKSKKQIDNEEHLIKEIKKVLKELNTISEKFYTIKNNVANENLLFSSTNEEIINYLEKYMNEFYIVA